MSVAIIGAGAIGNLVAAYLDLSGEDVFLVPSKAAYNHICSNGITITGVRGTLKANVHVIEKLDRHCDVTIFCTKTQDLQNAVESNLDFIKGSIIVTCQNGIRSERIVAEMLPHDTIISTIVMFGSTSVNPGNVIHNFEGPWIIGNYTKNIIGTKNISDIENVLRKAFPVTVSDNIVGMKYLKIFVNANNCIPAILGKSMQEVFSDPEICKISISIWKEGLQLIRKAAITLTDLPDFNVQRIESLTQKSLQESALIFSNIMTNLSKAPLYGSILQSIMRNKRTEIDYINGEFCHIAKEIGDDVPLNSKLVAMVKTVENNRIFFSKEELLREVKSYIQL